MELPKGKSVALCSEEVEYNISGLFLCIDLLFKLLTMVEEKFEYRMPIKYIYGAPKVRWNGGRFILKSSCDNFTIKDIENEVKQVISHEITPLFTFSNTLLELEDLKDKKCNQILELINEYRAQVIVASELLRYYIQEKYPNIEIHASVIKTAFEEKRDVDYYEKLSQEYSNYVIHPDDNFNYGLLQNIRKENAEIILNERCNYLCKIRSAHYQSISKEQVMQANGNYKNEKFTDACSAVPEIKQLSSKQRNISLTTDEMKKIASLGFRLFKIQGRTDSLYVYFFDLLRYTLESSIAFPTAYTIFSYYIEEYLKGN